MHLSTEAFLPLTIDLGGVHIEVLIVEQNFTALFHLGPLFI
jgi:hypothetical protein